MRLDVDWSTVAALVVGRGWARLPSVLDRDRCEELQRAAPDAWEVEPHQIGDVRQRGLRSGCYFETSHTAVQELGALVRESIDAAADAAAPLPGFDLVTWGRTDGGQGFITQHRDPPTAGGLIVVVNLVGRARFRVWDADGEQEWETQPGDVVLLRGTGWPDPASTCLLHEATAIDPDRWTLTYRHNTRGPDGDYFA